MCEDVKQIEAHNVILVASSPFYHNLLMKNKHAHALRSQMGKSLLQESNLAISSSTVGPGQNKKIRHRLRHCFWTRQMRTKIWLRKKTWMRMRTKVNMWKKLVLRKSEASSHMQHFATRCSSQASTQCDFSCAQQGGLSERNPFHTQHKHMACFLHAATNGPTVSL